MSDPSLKLEITTVKRPGNFLRSAIGSIGMEVVGLCAFALTRAHRLLRLPETDLIRTTKELGLYDSKGFYREARMSALSIDEIADLTKIPDLKTLYRSCARNQIIFSNESDAGKASITFDYKPPQISLSRYLLETTDTKPGFSLSLHFQPAAVSFGSHHYRREFFEIEPGLFAPDISTGDEETFKILNCSNLREELAILGSRSPRIDLIA